MASDNDLEDAIWAAQDGMGKVHDAVQRLKPAEVGAVHIEHVQQCLSRFRTALEPRDDPSSMDKDLVRDQVDELGYALGELLTYFRHGGGGRLHAKDAQVFATYLSGQIESLLQTARSINEGE